MRLCFMVLHSNLWTVSLSLLCFVRIFNVSRTGVVCLDLWSNSSNRKDRLHWLYRVHRLYRVYRMWRPTDPFLHQEYRRNSKTSITRTRITRIRRQLEVCKTPFPCLKFYWNLPLTRTVFRFPSVFELPGSTVILSDRFLKRLHIAKTKSIVQKEITLKSSWTYRHLSLHSDRVWQRASIAITTKLTNIQMEPIRFSELKKVSETTFKCYKIQG